MEEDQEELLLSTTDDESLANEDHSLPVDKVLNNDKHNLIYLKHTKAEFIIIKISLIFSTLALLIILPLYIEAVNVLGDVYSLFLTNTLCSSVLFTVITVVLKLTFSKYKSIQIFKLPIRWTKIIQMSLMYFLSALMILYALDRKRVVCHLQDPLKGLVLLWSFLYYFFFCQKFMHLQQIFSATAVIIGTFIALDYNLCDEFKCRGFERQHISDDTGDWPWQSHFVWTLVYVGGLALFAAYLTTLEQCFIGVIKTFHNYQAPLVTTPSSTVSTSSTCTSTENEIENTYLYKRINAIHLGMWLHIFGVAIAIFFFWTDFIPQIGKGSNSFAVLNHTISGIYCHFSNETGCKNLPIIAWLFLCSYVVFVTVLIQLLMLTQSAVYTVATMATALPLAGIWWSLVPMVPIEKGLLVWKPSFSGELVSSIIGLPVIIIGLYFLYKSYREDYHRSRLLYISQSQPTGFVT